MPTACTGIAVLSRTLKVLIGAGAEMLVGDKSDKNLPWVQISDVAGSSSADVSNIQSELSKSHTACCKSGACLSICSAASAFVVVPEISPSCLW